MTARNSCSLHIARNAERVLGYDKVPEVRLAMLPEDSSTTCDICGQRAVWIVSAEEMVRRE